VAVEKFFYGGNIWNYIKKKADVGSNKRMSAFTAIESSSGRLISSDILIEFTRNCLKLNYHDIQPIIFLTF